MTSRTAVVLGASGLVGGFCLRALVDDPDYTRVLTFGRRELPSLTRAKVAQRVADLATLSAEDFQGAQDVFCALGTTIRKAGSQEAFRHVDHGIAVAGCRTSSCWRVRNSLLWCRQWALIRRARISISAPKVRWKGNWPSCLSRRCIFCVRVC